MRREEFYNIFKNDDFVTWDGDNALRGLNIIAKYIPNTIVLVGAEHDQIYSVAVDKLIEAGITTRDANELKDMNWMIEDVYLSCFV